jgi:hypothetical protein
MTDVITMKYSQQIFAFLLALLAACVPLQPALAVSDALALAPVSMTHESGGAEGDIAALARRDQTGWDDQPANYVAFVTPGVKYAGYRTYQLPAGVVPASITALRVEVNYSGPSKRLQLWTWFLYDWSAAAWVRVGDNSKSRAWEWGMLIFNIPTPARFVSSTGEIRLRLTSNNGNNDTRLDYEAVHVLFTPALPPAPVSGDIPNPPAGNLYHGVYPGGVTGEEDDLTLADVQAYEGAAGKHAAWIYFSDNWYHGRAFPTETATWIRTHGSIPYVRLMLRSTAEQGRGDSLYTLKNILSGMFDNDLRAWCDGARGFGTRLIVEYGVEVNGQWFPWNGRWNGGGATRGYGDPNQPNGPERFRDAYRHIIQTCRDEGAENITWVFHVNDGDWPSASWNRFENYYPGDDYIDWLAVSVYGAQTPLDHYWDVFRESMDVAYPRLVSLSAAKPIIVAEFGVTANNPLGSQSQWAQDALTDITAFRWPHVIAFSWWNEWWQNDDNPAHDTDMRLQTNPPLADVFMNLVGNNPMILGVIP